MLEDTTRDILQVTLSNGPDLSGKVVVTDLPLKDLETIERLGAAGYVFLLPDRVWWHVSIAHEVKPWFGLQILKEALDKDANEITIDISSNLIPDYTTQNVVGMVKGKKHPDQYLVITAHYDHLGRMGKRAYFPGANDNASGTAMLLDLARYYSKPENQPDLSIVFIAFAAEEAGLLGSFYYVNHPLFPMENIKFDINLDMVGSGSEGIKVVNGAIYEKYFKKLQKINEKNGYLAKISKRGKAANSDHYPFYNKGIPSFFIYTLGPECSEYHNVYDTPDNVPFTEYEDLFHLLNRFIKTF